MLDQVLDLRCMEPGPEVLSEGVDLKLTLRSLHK